MANEINIPKTHLIMGLSLPLAVLLGYFIAEPMELGSMAVVVLVLAVLSIPLMMRWYYPFLVLSWNAAFCPAFLPGRPGLWALLAFGGLLFAVVNRAVSTDARFLIEPSITKPLLVLTGVVAGAGLLTGGFGLHMLGSSHVGGRNYFTFLAAVAGYFVFTSQRIPPQRAGLYVGLFFLAALTFGLGDLAMLGGSKMSFIFLFLSPDSSMGAGAAQRPIGSFGPDYVRVSDLSLVGAGLYSLLLARFGIRGVLDLTRPLRLLLLLAAVAAGLASGFRSFVVLGALIFAILFWLEGLHRTRYLPALLAVALLGAAIVLPQADKLPQVAQRALSFLPGKFDYMARADAEASTRWRIDVWKEVLPELPNRLFRLNGWGLDERDYANGVQIGEAGNQLTSVVLVGNYHNGPISVLMPFGIYGAIAFTWFLIAGLRLLHRNWKLGSPALQTVNTLLLATFAARVVFFLFFFGSMQSDMAGFVGLLGLSVALNGAKTAQAPAEQLASGAEFNTEYIKA
jgi:hypothetical protein